MIHIQIEGPDKKHYRRKSGSISWFEKLLFCAVGIFMVVVLFFLLKD